MPCCRPLTFPEDEQLKGDSWLASFKKAYGIKEFRWHGEAGSVDLSKDIFNFDETSFFAL